MTRINCVPAHELTDKHLGAEYYELPRIFKAVQKWDARGRDTVVPDTYRMGKGHVSFFYNKLKWILKRYEELCEECIKRGRKTSTITIPSLPLDLFQDWTPTPEAIAVNRQRIKDRLEGIT